MFFDMALGQVEPGDFGLQEQFPVGLYPLRGIDLLPIVRDLEKFSGIG